MVSYYDELEIEDFAWDDALQVFHYPCPCGDRFEISKSQLRDGEEIATCPSCSLIVRVIYDYLDWEDYETEDEDEGEGEEVETPATSIAPSPGPKAEGEGNDADSKSEGTDTTADLSAAVERLKVLNDS